MMKRKLLFLAAIACLVLYGCKDDEKADVLELLPASFDGVSSDGDTLQVNITCNDAWTTSVNGPSWCSVSPQRGVGDRMLTINVAANPGAETRKAVVTVASNGINKEIRIEQEAVDLETFRYTLPVIFHVLYQDRNDPLQYVDHARLAEILAVVNQRYEGNTNSPEMGLKFSLATIGPDGRTLDTPGVEYVQWLESYPIDCERFMSDKSNKYVKHIWDPNQYINVMVYNFAQADPLITILGLSHLPFSTEGSSFMEGLNRVEYAYLTLENLGFPYCASVNSTYINQQSTKNSYTPTDITVTMAHELGHYLGLHHVFSETVKGELISTCEDTDYCEDTPSYDRLAYNANYDWVVSPSSNIPAAKMFAYLVKRKDCSGREFTSYNIMDYSICYSNRFTADQRSRIRHVLLHSPLIPGPKKGQPGTRVAPDGVLDLPIRVMR